MSLNQERHWLVAVPDTNSVVQVDSLGRVLNTWAGFDEPLDIAVDPEGNMFVADSGSNQIIKLGPSGTRLAAWGSDGTLIQPRGVAVDSNGNIYVTNTDGRVVVFAPTS
jgi:serine/threonine-protein kinase